MRRYIILLVIGLSAIHLAPSCLVPPAPGDPYADAIVEFNPGTNAGFGQESLPDIVLGPPQGGGSAEGSLDVLALGHGGMIVLEFTDNIVVDEEGPDLAVYENAFYIDNDPENRFIEAGIVSVSENGSDFFEFPYQIDTNFPLGHPDRYVQLAGVTPVEPGEGPNGIGGDLFDLADVGLKSVRFVKIVDPGNLMDDPGNSAGSPPAQGFDLDAIGALHSQ